MARGEYSPNLNAPVVATPAGVAKQRRRDLLDIQSAIAGLREIAPVHDESALLDAQQAPYAAATLTTAQREEKIDALLKAFGLIQ